MDNWYKTLMEGDSEAAHLLNQEANYYHTPEQISAYFEKQRARAEREYAELVDSIGEERAKRYAGDIFDAHSCSELAINGGYCAFCDKVVPGSPAWFEIYGGE